MKFPAPQFAALAVAIPLLVGSLVADDEFAKNVAPVLQQHCFRCHNDESNKGGFSLQNRQSAFKDDHIVKGDSASSHFVDLVRPVDGSAEMPKDASPLSQQEIDVLVKWIDGGAPWPADFQLTEPVVTDFDWWSYQPIKRPSVPAITSKWIRTPVDAFVLQTLKSKGLTYSESADRRTLIRRVTFDLTGLPPSHEDVRAFAKDDSPDAYEKLVDRLLDSKHYGERWARHWLDVVKYGDTCGYDKDKLRNNAWPYRDYVIRSFNEDKPYSRFVQEQVAGDVLFPGEPDGILGLGFIAAGPWDFIGHVEVPESKIDGKVARNLDRDDMVSNTINTFCSLTVQCARCHNHKFDPITQESYYALQSIFAAVDRAERVYDTDPETEAKRNEFTKQLSSARKRLKEANDEITKAGGERLRELHIEIGELEPTVTSNKPLAYGYHSQISKSQESAKWVEVDLGKPTAIDRIVLKPCDDDFAGIGAGFGFPLRFKVEVKDQNRWIVVFDQTKSDLVNPGIVELPIEFTEVTASVIRLTATKLAERKNDYILAIAELRAFDAKGTNLAAGKTVRSLDSIQAMPRWARKNLTDGKWPIASDAAAAKKLAQLQKERAALMAQAETPERVTRREKATANIKRLSESIRALPKGKMVYAAATHFKPQGNFKPTEGKSRPVHVLHRGNVQQPKQAADVGMIPLPGNDGKIDAFDKESLRRAALAKWLTADDHPLVWRSIANRIWQYHFGSGIVATPNDFGRMGATPTHPELLDWLASEFRDGGQTMKRIHRLIVTSSVYRQSSDSNGANEKTDGGNQYLWRMPRRRLSAEEIRDSMLSVSGVLDPKMGGPGFYLFALERTQHSPHYEYHKFDPNDPNSHRRSVYRFIARSQPDPWMTTLDCADSSQSTPKRNETLTSLQALSLMNNRFNLAMAESFAKSISERHSDLDAQLRFAFQRVAQRDPTDQELGELVSYASVHGLTNACRFLFNLSEFVFLD